MGPDENMADTNRSRPMMGQRYLGTVAVDEHATPMLHRMAANWSNDERSMYNPRLHVEDRGPQPLQQGLSHYGSMSSLAPPGHPYGHVSHQRSRAGRSLDEGDPTMMTPSSSYGLLSAATSGRASPGRRPHGVEKSSSFTQNGRNSPRLAGSASNSGQAPNLRHRQQGMGEPRGSVPSRLTGTSFSSSYH